MAAIRKAAVHKATINGWSLSEADFQHASAEACQVLLEKFAEPLTTHPPVDAPGRI